MGIDQVTNGYVNAQNPANCNVPKDVDILPYPTTSETRQVTAAAFTKKYSTIIKKDGTRVESVTEYIARCWFTEIQPEQNGETSFFATATACVPRNTSSLTFSKRDVCMPDKNGKQETTEEQLKIQPGILVIATNANETSHFANTLEVVTHVCAAGAVDDAHGSSGGSKSVAAARADCGVQAKFHGKKNIPWVAEVSHLLSRDILTLSAMTAFIHSCKFFGSQGQLVVTSGIENSWMDVIVALVHNHTPFMSARAACQQNWNRIDDMARARIVPWAVMLHATQTLADPATQRKSWDKILHTCVVNFVADPCPTQCLPVFLGNLLCTSFDWMFFLCVLMFADFFSIPYLPPDVVERLFSDPTYVVPDKHAKKMQKWFKTVGVIDASSRGSRSRFHVMAASIDAPREDRGVLYATSAYEGGEEIRENTLVANIEVKQATNAFDEAKSVPPSERFCTQIGKMLAKRYATPLHGACNIIDDDRNQGKAWKPIAACLHRYSALKRLTYHKFGPVPSGQGWKSTEGLLRSLGVDEDVAVDGYLSSTSSRCEETFPFFARQTTGSVWQFGACWKWMLIMRAVAGKGQLISQIPVQRFFQHCVEQFIQHRVPRFVLRVSVWACK